ncbi:MAG TPA: formate dehydrogenase accessory sulfurtransferase FdhD [Longimicrobiales bacterium]
MPGRNTARWRLEQVVAGDDGAFERRSRRDALAVEEPLEIRLVRAEDPAGAAHQVAVTMRTPGADFELAAGFLYGEGVVGGREQIETIRYCVDPAVDGPQRYNILNVVLARGVPFDPAVLRRNFYTTSSCGVCGKASIDAVRAQMGGVVHGAATVAAGTLLALPARLREGQRVFERTGGLHAAALFTVGGELLAIREDVGRHNAMDKLVGAMLLEGALPLADHVILVSGRLSFELVQKAVRAGATVLAGVSAPSSLAVELAAAAGLTLVGFLREGRFNVYTGGARVVPAPRTHHPPAG